MNPEPAERSADFDDFHAATARRTAAVVFGRRRHPRGPGTATAAPDTAAQTGAPRAQLEDRCGISAPLLPDTPSPRGTPLLFSGASKPLPGVTAWVESQGRYVAVLLVTVPDGPQVKYEGTGIAKCIDTSLHSLTSRAPATGTPATVSGGAHTSDNC